MGVYWVRRLVCPAGRVAVSGTGHIRDREEGTTGSRTIPRSKERGGPQEKSARLPLFFIDQLRCVPAKLLARWQHTVLTAALLSRLLRLQSGSIYVRPVSPRAPSNCELTPSSRSTEFLSDVVLLTQKSRNVYKSR